MIQVSWSGELQLNYDDCVKLMKVKKIHDFMLNDFREIISQHHNIYATLVPDTERCPRTPVFLCRFIKLSVHWSFVIGSTCHKASTHSFWGSESDSLAGIFLMWFTYHF